VGNDPGRYLADDQGLTLRYGIVLMVAMALLLLGSSYNKPSLAVPRPHQAPPASPAGPPVRPSVVLIGDSHAWLWGTEVNGGIPDLGEPGLNTTQIELQVPEALAMHPRYVVISGGTNDLVQGQSWRVPAANLALMVREIRAGGATPVILVVPPFSTMVTTPWASIGLLATSTATILDLGGSNQLPQLNAAIEALGTPLLTAPAGETVDGVHLDPAAYDQLDRQLTALIEQ
jgi:lysophospholipase L1-like esterase